MTDSGMDDGEARVNEPIDTATGEASDVRVALETDTKPSGVAFQPTANVSSEVIEIGRVFVRCVYCALSPTIVIVSGLALLVNAFVWRLLALVLLGNDAAPFGRPIYGSLDQWIYPSAISSLPNSWIDRSVVGQVYQELIFPWKQLSSSSGSDFLFWLLGGLSTLAIWALVGTFICRLLALRLNSKTAKAKNVFKFAMASYVDSIGSILIPLVAVLVLALPLAVAGLFLASDFLSPLGAILTLVLGIVSVPMAVVLVGLILCWPLMFPAIALEGRDCFESISRGYAYVFQRPFHYLGLSLVTVLAGIGLSWLFTLLGDTAVGCLHWGLSWGTNVGDAERLTEVLRPVVEGDEATSGVVTWFSSPLVHFWSGVLQWGVRSAAFATFWGLAVGTYLLLRRYLDQAPLDSIYLEGDRKLGQLAKEPAQNSDENE